MKCTKCSKGNIIVHAHYEAKETYFQDNNGEWKKRKADTIGYDQLYAECDSCQKSYGVNEYKFFHENTIEIFELDDIQVIISVTEDGRNPSVTICEDNKAIFSLIESLGYEIDPVMINMTPTPGIFRKYYKSPNGSGIFKDLTIEESAVLLEKTEKALSDNGIIYSTKVLTLADML